MPHDERYIDCESCKKRFVGEAAIKSGMREDLGWGRIVDVCISCFELGEKYMERRRKIEQREKRRREKNEQREKRIREKRSHWPKYQ